MVSGLPYHVGGVIPEESQLAVATGTTFRTKFAIDAQPHCKAIAISRTNKTVDLNALNTGTVGTESYD
jgi:hypothetical protein